MKRILSLALVLVMILSVMPTALAAAPDLFCEICGEKNWVASEADFVDATCEKDGKEVYTCGTTTEGVACTGSKEVTVTKGDGSCNWADVNPSDDTATCTAAGKKTQVCADCGATKQVDTPIKAHTDVKNNETSAEGADNKCDVCGTAMTVNVGVSAAASKSTLIVGESTTINLSYTALPAGGTVTGGTWSSSDASIASVVNGTVTANKKGTATITVSGLTPSSGITLDKTSVSVQITVNDGGVIICDNKETVGSSTTITPTLKVNDTAVDATFSFSGTGVTTSSDKRSAYVSSSKTGIVKVTVEVLSYAGSTSADLANIADKDVYVSFYESVDATATVKSGVTSFMFDDTGVFSSVTIDGDKYSIPGNISMMNLWSCDADWYGIDLYQEDQLSTIASIKYVGADFAKYDAYAVNKFNMMNVDDLKFSCLKKGSFDLSYILYDDDTNLIVQVGDLTINVSEGEGDIEYSTSFTKKFTLDEDDFYKLWNKSDLDSKLSYVTFDTTAVTGKLRNSSDSDAKSVSDTMKFNYAYTSKDTGYDLDDVTYEPYSKAVKAYEENIPFICYGEDSSDVLHGLMIIKVGDEMNFTDVKKTDYFYDAVEWAVNKGVTSGTSATTFSPAKTCTRAEVVTFLWRAAGEPAVTGYLPFTDVDDDAYYYDAVLWAYKNDITTGLTSTTFGPHSTVTRGQVVTFLWRAMDELSVSASNPFNDVKRTDYFYEAVLWAVKNDVTTGLTSTTFGPNSGCTRGQIVTFLYRAYEGE